MSPNDPSPIFSRLANHGDLTEIVQEFVANLQGRLDALQAAFDGNDLAKISRLAHQLKGAGGGHGFDVISTAAADLESATRSAESVEQVRSKLEELTILCHRATASPPPH